MHWPVAQFSGTVSRVSMKLVMGWKGEVEGSYVLRCFKVPAMEVSGFKPGSTLSDPGRGQPTSLEPLKWSIMSSDGLVHPWKII